MEYCLLRNLYWDVDRTEQLHDKQAPNILQCYQFKVIWNNQRLQTKDIPCHGWSNCTTMTRLFIHSLCLSHNGRLCPAHNGLDMCNVKTGGARDSAPTEENPLLSRYRACRQLRIKRRSRTTWKTYIEIECSLQWAYSNWRHQFKQAVRLRLTKQAHFLSVLDFLCCDRLLASRKLSLVSSSHTESNFILLPDQGCL